MNNLHFRIQSVEVMKPYNLSIAFKDGKTFNVNLERIIKEYPALTPLTDEVLFSQVHVDESGTTLIWTDEIDLAGDNLRAEAVEQSGDISHERIWNWMHRNSLTLDTAASALGISRRMVAYYRNGERPIPKHIWFACLGWEHFGNNKSGFKLAA
jgi:hypothetical protein